MKPSCIGSRENSRCNGKAQSREQKSENPNPQSQILDPQSEAEECFLKAIDIARQQQAKSWELRATMSLCRLWQQQAVERGAQSREQGVENKKHVIHNGQHETRNRLGEAHKMLAEIYNWFTEGFETADLQEAKTLLEEEGLSDLALPNG
jgi:predicted ATPase